MPRSKREASLERVRKAKDNVRRLESLLDDARAEAGRAIVAAGEQGVTKSELCALWSTSYSQLDRLIARAQA